MSFPKAGELHGMVMPTLSIDEYESKLGKEQQVIVVAFLVNSEDAGKDIRDFVERGTVPLIDCEVSASPNEDLQWMVFFEYKRDGQFWVKLSGTVGEIERLCGERMDWQVYTYLSDAQFTMDDPALKEMVPLTPADYVIRKYYKKKGELKEEVDTFFKDSLVENIKWSGQNLVVHTRVRKLYLTPEKIDESDKILESSMMEPVNMVDISLDEELLRRSLGGCYAVNSTKDKLYIQNTVRDTILVLKKYG